MSKTTVETTFVDITLTLYLPLRDMFQEAGRYFRCDRINKTCKVEVEVGRFEACNAVVSVEKDNPIVIIESCILSEDKKL